MPVADLIIEHVYRDKYFGHLDGQVNSGQRIFAGINAVFVQLVGINFKGVGFLCRDRQCKAEK